MIRWPLALATLCVAASPVWSQSDTTKKTHWYDAFGIRQTFAEQYASRPATFDYLKAAHDSSVLSVAIAVRYLLSSATTDFGPTIEYQRSTSPSKPQDVLTVGANLTHSLWNDNPTGVTPEILASTNFKHDAVAKKESAQASGLGTVYVDPCRKTIECFYRPGQRTETPVLAFRYVPFTGIEYEHYFASTPGGRDVARWLLSEQSQYYPLPKVFKYRVQLTVDYAYRRSSTLEPRQAGRDHHLFTACANLFILKSPEGQDANRTVGLTISYSKGDDPSKGLPVQEITKAGLAVQF